jgi:hypothetical protein
MIEDMTIHKLVPKTQQSYIRNVKAFAAFLGRTPGTAYAHLGQPRVRARFSARPPKWTQNRERDPDKRSSARTRFALP